ISASIEASSMSVPKANHVLYVTSGVIGLPWRMPMIVYERSAALACATPPGTAPITTCGPSTVPPASSVVDILPRPSENDNASPTDETSRAQAPDHNKEANHVSFDPAIAIHGTAVSEDRPVEPSVSVAPLFSCFDRRVKADSWSTVALSPCSPVIQ